MVGKLATFGERIDESQGQDVAMNSPRIWKELKEKQAASLLVLYSAN